MKFFSQAKQLLMKVDLFQSPQLLRYNRQAEYKTLTGGFISLCAIIAVIIGFSSMVMSTFRKDQIYSTIEIAKTGDPSPMELVGGQNYFMFGLFIQTLDVSTTFDLLNGPQFFDIVMREVVIKHGTYPEFNTMSLEKCTIEHWKMEPTVVKNFDNYKVSKWLCPKLHQTYRLSGIYGSDQYSYMQFSIYPCKNQSSNGNHCAPQTQIDQLFEDHQNFYITLSYTNAVMNPSQVNYKSYYYESENYLMFSKKIGAESWVYLSDFTIESDNSILPFRDLTIDRGYIGETIGSKLPFSVSQDGRMASMYLAKSRNSLKYQRNVLKGVQVISFMGGLISALAGLLFILKFYTETSFQMNISSQLFYLPSQNQKLGHKEKNKSDEQTEEQSVNNQKMRFNFITFICLYFYKMLKLFRRGESLAKYKKMDQLNEQVMNQLDVKLLLFRILKLQLYISQFSREQNIRVVKQWNQITLEKAKQLRNLFVYQNQFASTKILIENGGQHHNQDKLQDSLQSPGNLFPRQTTINKMLEQYKHKDIVCCQQLEQSRQPDISDNFLTAYYPKKQDFTSKREMAIKQHTSRAQEGIRIKELTMAIRNKDIGISAKDIISFERQPVNNSEKQPKQMKILINGDQQ